MKSFAIAMIVGALCIFSGCCKCKKPCCPDDKPCPIPIPAPNVDPKLPDDMPFPFPPDDSQPQPKRPCPRCPNR